MPRLPGSSPRVMAEAGVIGSYSDLKGKRVFITGKCPARLSEWDHSLVGEDSLWCT